MNLKRLLKNYQFELTQTQNEQLLTYFTFLVEYNENVNLTALTSEEDVFVKHFLDSLLIFKNVELKNKKVLDLGAGAGFPSIPNAILNPNANFTIIEPLNKRCVFLNLLIKKLNINNVIVICKRGEDIDDTEIEQFDICSARAVAKANILLELLAKYTKIAGQIILPKANLEFNEKHDALNAADKLFLTLDLIESYNFEGNERNNMIFTKIKKTPKIYPRNFGQIKKSPLK